MEAEEKSKRRIKKIYFASVREDSNQEWEMFPQAVRIVNSRQTNGIYLEPHISEITEGHLKRPRDSATEEISKCDLVILVIGRYLGRSPDEHSIVDKFNIAHEQEKEVWVYFREIEPPYYDDADVKETIQFRNKLEISGDYFTRRYKTLGEWSVTLQNDLFNWTKNISHKEENVAENQSETPAEGPAIKGEKGKTSPPSPEPPDALPLHQDNPAVVDALHRKPFADALARHLRRVWEVDHKAITGDQPQDDTRSAFMLHLHGPWGSGKSTILNLMRKDLQKPDQPDKDKWVVVDFNAWRHQHVRPPWWPLMDTVFKQAVEQLRDKKFLNQRIQAERVASQERWRRFRAGKALVYFLSGFAFAVIAVALILWLRFAVIDMNIGIVDVFKIIATAISIGGSVWGFSKSLSRSLLPGSSEAAQKYMRFEADPMERLSDHFDSLIRSIGQPVAIFIDDLDRCHPDYVVELLEGIQTLFRNTQVVYVVPADRRWISTCFEDRYTCFKGTIAQKGHRLGYLFVEKAFQLSVRVPRLSGTTANEYWGRLLMTVKGERDRSQYDAFLAQADKLFAEDQTEARLLKKYEEVRSKSEIPEPVMREAVIKKLSSREVRQQQEHSLQKYSDFLERNPRAMKRLVNFYSLYREATVSEGIVVKEPMLVRWLILLMRWPLLAEHLDEYPENVAYIGKPQEGESAVLPLIHPEEARRELLELMRDRQVIMVVGGDGRFAPLTEQEVRDCTGRGELKTTEKEPLES